MKTFSNFASARLCGSLIKPADQEYILRIYRPIARLSNKRTTRIILRGGGRSNKFRRPDPHNLRMNNIQIGRQLTKDAANCKKLILNFNLWSDLHSQATRRSIWPCHRIGMAVQSCMTIIYACINCKPMFKICQQIAIWIWIYIQTGISSGRCDLYEYFGQINNQEKTKLSTYQHFGFPTLFTSVPRRAGPLILVLSFRNLIWFDSVASCLVSWTPEGRKQPTAAAADGEI